MTNWDWMDKHEEKVQEERNKDYFNIVEGANRFVLLSEFAPIRQVFNPTTGKYRLAEEGDKSVSIKGVCWVLQDGVIKLARIPYVVVKTVRELAKDPEWDFKFPFPHVLTLSAKGAGTKEVEYSLTPSPKLVDIPAEVIEELAKKPSPEEMVEKLKGKTTTVEEQPAPDVPSYPEEEINPDDIPF